MPYLLILFSLLFIACKKENQVSQHAVVKSSEQKSFITIAHNEGESVFRNKIMNAIVEGKFPDEKEVSALKKGDELIGYEMNKRDMELYRQREQESTKLIVSFSDRLEIYFVPKQVVVKGLIDQLGLRAEAQRRFKWLNADEVQTAPGQTLYLISINHEDLMENDKKFYQENYDLRDLPAKKSFSVESYREVLVNLKYQFFREVPVVKNFTGKKIPCSRELLESGGCGFCEYKKSIPSGQYQRAFNASLDELGVKMKLDGQDVTLANLAGQLKSAEEVIFRFTPETLVTGVALKIELEKINPLSRVVNLPVERNHLCTEDEGRGSITLGNKAHVDLKVTILGRGEKLRSIRL